MDVYSCTGTIRPPIRTHISTHKATNISRINTGVGGAALLRAQNMKIMALIGKGAPAMDGVEGLHCQII